MKRQINTVNSLCARLIQREVGSVYIGPDLLATSKCVLDQETVHILLTAQRILIFII